VADVARDSPLRAVGQLPFAQTIHTYITEIKKLDADQRAKAKEQDAEIEEGVYRAIVDPKKKMVPPSKEPIPPYLNFAPLDNAAVRGRFARVPQ
jgi:N-acetylated-alpha-linked acidic dipeptidase